MFVKSAIDEPLSWTSGSCLAALLPEEPEAAWESGGFDDRFLDLLDRFRQIPDIGSEQGRWHPVPAVLVLSAAAVVAGSRSFAAITGWVADVLPEVLAALYRRCGFTGPQSCPSKCTIWRAITGADAPAVDAAIGGWLAHQGAAADAAAFADGGGEDGVPLSAIAVDGKAARGAKKAGGQAVFLLAAATHDRGLVLAQTDVSVKTNEIPLFAPLLDLIDIKGKVITADSLHTQRAHARYLHEREAFFVFCVKGNQPSLYAAIDELPWSGVPVGHTSVTRGAGRIATRTMRVLPAPEDLPFPHTAQVFLLERHVTDLHGSPVSGVGILGVTALSAEQAGPAALANLVRGQWAVETVHWVRDVVYAEDGSTAHTRSGPRVMAALRNLAIGALRLAGRDDIAEANRWSSRRPERPFKILGIVT